MSSIIVTGAGKGIGYELVKLYASNGHQVVAVSRDLSALKTDAIKGVSLYEADLATANLDEVVDFAITEMGSVDVLINNAGAILNKPFAEITRQEMEYTYTINVFAAAGLIQALTNRIDKTHSLHTVNVSSMGGFQGSAKFPGLSIYSSSKGALSILTECLAEEFRETAFKFNALCLGAVQTEMLSQAFPGYKAPLLPVEMAGFISDFSLNAHRYMNGKVLPVSLSTP